MNKSNSVGWFEIPVVDLDRAEKFYEDFFGLKLSRQGENLGIAMSWFPMGDPQIPVYGATGTLIKGDAYKPSHEGSLLYFLVDSVEDSLKKAEEMGRKILLTKTSIGEHGFIGWLEDTEGNRIALHSMQG